jgi:D-aminopeptidase
MPPNDRPRIRDLGLHIGTDQPGPHNAITDVSGVRVGHVTLIEGEGPSHIGQGPIRTGVTAIVPPGPNFYDQPFEAGHSIFNGAGTTAGLSFIDEFGRLETPILLTNTLSVGTAYEGIVQYMVEHIFKPRGAVPWFNPVVGETSDAFLNDIGGLHVRPHHAVQAIEQASDGPVAEGVVGGGTGMSVFGFKGGIGTSSRLVEIGGESATIGVLVQSNFGGRLAVAGVPMTELQRTSQPPPSEGSSIMIIVATDLPLCNRLLTRLAKRASFGLARTGSSGGHGSGDYIIAFSTTYRKTDTKPAIRAALSANESNMDIAFRAIADATEEAILNSLFRAHRLVGRDGNTREAFPIDQAVDILKRHNVL